MARHLDLNTGESLTRASRRCGHPWVWGSVLLWALVGLFVGGLGGEAQAARLHVANNGTDSGTCGAKNTPCRSISQAIANANVADTIKVGPGRYGDLNGNGTFGEVGEEAAEVGFGCFCMIKVNQQLTLVSRDGAGATVLDAGGVSVTVVKIEASGVIFGRPKKGFTLTGGSAPPGGLLTGIGTSEVKVAGNISSANQGDGFRLIGSEHELSGNVASGNGGVGFQLGPGTNANKLHNNLATANAVGFLVGSFEHELSDNISSANGGDGFILRGGGSVLKGNSALGNKGAGIRADTIFEGFPFTITKNNIYGNDDPSGGNCGLFNESGSDLVATDNFWGAATGPGADPADHAGPGSGCDAGASSTTVVPFATKEFKVPPVKLP